MRLLLKDIAEAVNGTLNNPAFGGIEITGVTTDSRNVPGNSLFVPIRGVLFDGHDFIHESLNRGADCALSAIPIDSAKPVVFVKDTRAALLSLAERYLSHLFPNRLKAGVVAVTGSSGKTTTKDIIASVLAQKYIVHKNQGNLNNDIGLPQTIFNMPNDAEAAVFELGMNHFGEISALSKVCKPDIAVITNIGVAHIENLGSRVGILRAKLEILDGMTNNGTLVLNGDDELLRNGGFGFAGREFFYGFGKNCNIRARNTVKNGVDGVGFTCETERGSFIIDVPIPGTHMVYNALAAIAVGLQNGLTEREIQQGIRAFKPSGGRMRIIRKDNGITVIDDTYNANPDSVAAALDVLSEAKGRKVAVLGDMLELGEDSPRMHYECGRLAADKGIDLILCVGEKSRQTYLGACDSGNSEHFQDKAAVIEYLNNGLKAGDTVLIKASRGKQFEDIAASL